MQFVVMFLKLLIGIVTAVGMSICVVLLVVLLHTPTSQKTEYSFASDTPVLVPFDTSMAPEKTFEVANRGIDTTMPSAEKMELPHSPPSVSTKENTPVSTTIVEHGSISSPGPLLLQPEMKDSRAPLPLGGLLSDEIIRLTNIERERAGITPLIRNARLGAMAEAKAFDMIARHYFAHTAPDGTDISALAEKYGYAYLNIGENLALGEFATSGAVISGWMNSPGHRANILNVTFQEIGVAVLRGRWEGKEVWFAVQEFGRPLSDCPIPNPSLKTKIALWEDHAKRLAAILEGLKRELEDSTISPESYNAKVDDYNTIATLYNKLVDELRADTVAYNRAVDVFNTCATTTP